MTFTLNDLRPATDYHVRWAPRTKDLRTQQLLKVAELPCRFLPCLKLLKDIRIWRRWGKAGDKTEKRRHTNGAIDLFLYCF